MAWHSSVPLDTDMISIDVSWLFYLFLHQNIIYCFQFCRQSAGNYHNCLLSVADLVLILERLSTFVMIWCLWQKLYFHESCFIFPHHLILIFLKFPLLGGGGGYLKKKKNHLTNGWKHTYWNQMSPCRFTFRYNSVVETVTVFIIPHVERVCGRYRWRGFQ